MRHERPMRGHRWMQLVGVGVLLAACGGAAPQLDVAFNRDWQNDAGASITAVEKRVRGAELPPNAAVVVGVNPSGMVAVGLDGTGRWKSKVGPEARPIITGLLVVVSEGPDVIALDAKTGKKLWSVPNEGHQLRGAGTDGKLTAVSLARRAGGGSVLLGVDATGDVVRRVETPENLGRPAVKGGVAFVPWRKQYVSAIDLGSGDEIGRLLLRERVTHAVNVGGFLYFGESGLVRLDERIGGATGGNANRVGLPERTLPGEPEWFQDGTNPTPTAATARDRIRLYARPRIEAGNPTTDSDRYLATYFRIMMALDSSTGALAWVRTLPESVIGGAAAQGGFVVCDADGNVRMLDATTGGEASSLALGEVIQSCVVSPGEYQVLGAKNELSLAEQLGTAVDLDDTEMAAAQEFLLTELGKERDPAATKTLVKLARDPRTPSAILQETRRLIAERRTGAEFMLEALKEQYDFLSDVLQGPPVGPLADALAAMNEKRAAPLLARHLNDPANTPDDVKRAAHALTSLATAKEVDDLKIFFSLYRATADSPELIAATIDVARALVNVGGEDGREVVRKAALDPLTRSEIRQAITKLASSGSTSKAARG